MRRVRTPLVLLSAALWLTVAGNPSWATRSGTTLRGVTFEHGGVSHEELLDLHGRRQAYSLWVVTAALRSGAFLADVRVTVRDSRDHVVFDQALDGPWLFLGLAPGRYQVEARLNGKIQQRSTTVHPADHHQMFFYFDTGDDVGAENRSPFPSSPYATPAGTGGVKP